MNSLISDGVKYAGEKHGPTSTTHYGNGAVVEEPFESNTARTIQRLADQAVERSANRPATVTINQGTVLNVYVAQDIDFTGVLPRINRCRQPSIEPSLAAYHTPVPRISNDFLDYPYQALGILGSMSSPDVSYITTTRPA